jgi:hypothetical protein
MGLLDTDSLTKTTESGVFIRTTIRRGKRRKQKTRRLTPNDEKVVLGHLGDFELYAYPYKYPDTCFIGAFPTSTAISKNTVGEIMAVYNKATWFLNGEWQNEAGRGNAANCRRRACEKSYNAGLRKLTEPKT